MITNKEHADNFLNYYYRKENKFLVILRGIAEAIDLQSEEYAAELEDELIITVTKCYNRIKEAGLSLHFQNGKKLTWNETYAAYLYKALKNNLVQHAKKKQTQWDKEAKFLDRTKTERLNLFDPEDKERDEMSLIQQERLETLTQAAVDQLPSKYQDVLYMLADGLTYKDIEKVLALSIGKVKRRIMTARKMAKQYMKEAIETDLSSARSSTD